MTEDFEGAVNEKVDDNETAADGAALPDLIDVALVVGPGKAWPAVNLPAGPNDLYGIKADSFVEYRLVHLRGRFEPGQLDRLAETLLIDRVGQWWMERDEHQPSPRLGRSSVVETGLRPGVTDREGAELLRAAREHGWPVEAAAIAKRWFIYGALVPDQIARLARLSLHNEVVERWALGELPPAHTDPEAVAVPTARVGIRGQSREHLQAIGDARRLGLNVDELEAIRDWYEAAERDPTDAELETLAQTWSEHCSHKTFRAHISMDDGTEVDGLLDSYLRAATDAIDAPWVESAFVDNAGIVHFDHRWDLALKAETHNHPSALEPFGGANTGVGGVVRDILGVSAKPIAITDVLCFGPDNLAQREVPEGVLPPNRIREGVIAGVGDYGNKIGVPNLAGAIIHHPSYTTTPLVFAGCIGLLPRGSNPTEVKVGDAIVVLGGRVGRDGVGGATFSSQSMTATTADVAGSSVQIGDPVVEKGLIDVVIEARDARLYNAITDCGAGGLSSAVGEMAEHTGARVDLRLVPRKYPGLAPWEVWLSEAQERMVLATSDPGPLLALAKRWQVEASVIGTFTGDGQLVVVDGEEGVIDLNLGFLHGGRPRLMLKASAPNRVRQPRREPEAVPAGADYADILRRLLAHPSIRSNEDVIRGYDHEIMAGTLVRPYSGAERDGPADGTVMLPPGTYDPTEGSSGGAPVPAMVIGIGSAVHIGEHDTEAMAWAAVDEAIRNAVVAGADPAQLSLLDNFAWGNPTDPATLGHLVAACRGCHDAALAHGAPFVSGKDSLFNEFVFPDGRRDPVTPTLIITAVGIVRDIATIPNTGLTAAGNDVWLVGPMTGALGRSCYDDVIGTDGGGPVPAPDRGAALRHAQVHAAIAAGLVASAHDLSEGGLAVAAAEWAFAGRLGLTVPTSEHHGAAELFGEGAGRYLLEVSSDQRDELLRLIPGVQRIGSTTDDRHVRFGPSFDLSVEDIEAAYRHGRTTPAQDSQGGQSR